MTRQLGSEILEEGLHGGDRSCVGECGENTALHVLFVNPDGLRLVVLGQEVALAAHRHPERIRHATFPLVNADSPVLAPDDRAGDGEGDLFNCASVMLRALHDPGDVLLQHVDIGDGSRHG